LLYFAKIHEQAKVRNWNCPICLLPAHQPRFDEFTFKVIMNKPDGHFVGIDARGDVVYIEESVGKKGGEFGKVTTTGGGGQRLKREK
jgi:hypothetical protein